MAVKSQSQSPQFTQDVAIGKLTVVEAPAPTGTNTVWLLKLRQPSLVSETWKPTAEPNPRFCTVTETKPPKLSKLHVMLLKSMSVTIRSGRVVE